MALTSNEPGNEIVNRPMLGEMFTLIRFFLRQLVLMVPSIRAVVDQRDRYLQTSKELELELQGLAIKNDSLDKQNLSLKSGLQRLTTKCQFLLVRDSEHGKTIERLTTESSVALKANQELLLKSEALRLEHASLKIRFSELVAKAQDQAVAIEDFPLRKHAPLRKLPNNSKMLLENPRDKVVLLHIPKTAGTSLSNLLYKVFYPGEILTDFSDCRTDELGHFLRRDIEQFVRSLSKEQFDNCKVFSGHLSVGFERSLDFTARYVTFVRNPINRLLSGFLYGTEGIANLSKDFILFGLHRSVSTGSSLGFDNPLTRILSGSDILTTAIASGSGVPVVTKSDRHAAIRLLQSKFGFVGLTERFDDSCKLLFPLLAKICPSENVRLNETVVQFGIADIPLNTLGAIERHHVHDIAVYAAACELFNEHAHSRNMELAKPYIRKTIGGAFSSGDYAHTVSCADAFGGAPDGVWLSFPNYRVDYNEFIGFEFESQYNCTAVEIQIASLHEAPEIFFTVEVSDDYFFRDIRRLRQIGVPADRKRHVVKLIGHDIAARCWRLARKSPLDNIPLAIAFLSFSPVLNVEPIRDMAVVLEKLKCVQRKYNEETYVSLLNNEPQINAALVVQRIAKTLRT